jgi:hypothetical protein
MSMKDYLASLSAGITPTQAVDDVIQTSFQQYHQIIPGNTGLPLRLGKEAAELSLQNPIGVTCLLFLSKL